MKITVYCGANKGFDPAYEETAKQLGYWIADHGHTLVYGGGAFGLMGALADAVLEHHGKVIGICPRFFDVAGVVHKGLTQLIWVDTMSVRKTKMIEYGDAFVALPGGIGTLEEIVEVISLNQLDRIAKPYALMNVNGYYDTLDSFFSEMTRKGFLAEEKRSMIKLAKTPEDLGRLFGG
ncbi:MAG: TIGR00730 family Rossman fold protein [Erysipelotrichales bacterium]|nr:TIGR00730 family Rossman fold protein [Erysipelotrichales bacterium]